MKFLNIDIQDQFMTILPPPPSQNCYPVGHTFYKASEKWKMTITPRETQGFIVLNQHNGAFYEMVKVNLYCY